MPYPYIIRDAETGYAPPGVSAFRTYATAVAAQRAAQRAADRTGRAVAYGMAKVAGADTIKYQAGVCQPRPGRAS